MSWENALKTLRAAAGRWSTLAASNVSIAVAPSEARDLATALGALVVEMEEANRATLAACAALRGSSEILADWAERLEAYAATISATAPETADVVRGLATEVLKMARASSGTNQIYRPKELW